jgi:hypothetical protein
MRLESSQKWEPVTAIFNFPLPSSSGSGSSGYGTMVPPNSSNGDNGSGDGAGQQTSPLPQQTYSSQPLPLDNELLRPTEKSGYKKLWDTLKETLIVVILTMILILLWILFFG